MTILLLVLIVLSFPILSDNCLLLFQIVIATFFLGGLIGIVQVSTQKLHIIYCNTLYHYNTCTLCEDMYLLCCCYSDQEVGWVWLSSLVDLPIPLEGQYVYTYMYTVQYVCIHVHVHCTVRMLYTYMYTVQYVCYTRTCTLYSTYVYTYMYTVQYVCYTRTCTLYSTYVYTYMYTVQYVCYTCTVNRLLHCIQAAIVYYYLSLPSPLSLPSLSLSPLLSLSLVRASFVCFIVALLIFFDDYTCVLITGNSLRMVS